MVAQPRMGVSAGTGYALVDGSVECVVTRFRLKSVMLTPLFWWAFLKVKRSAMPSIPGLLRSELLFESPCVCYTLSIWADEAALQHFNRLISHVQAATWVMRQIHRTGRRSVEIWSTQWKLHAVSHHLVWGDLQFKDLIRPQSSPAPTASERS